MSNYGINEYQQTLKRTCKICGCQYTIGDYLETNEEYFPRPHAYRSRCETHCLECWLGVGINDFPSEGNASPEMTDTEIFSGEELADVNFQSVEPDGWPYEVVYKSLVDGDLLTSYKWFLDSGVNLAIMPIDRLHVERTIVFPGAVTFYPPGWLDLDQLNFIPSQNNTKSLADLCSVASGITLDVLEKHSLVVFPCQFDWEGFRQSSHEAHLNFIRWLSEAIEQACLNFVRYQSCCLEEIDDIPAHPGQVASNHMMAGALLYNGGLRESRIIGGAAFTHYLTRGLGLPLNQLEWDSFPQDGETGQIVQHALSLYASLLESDNPTTRFMQTLSLLEFLAYPDEYQKFEKVSKVIARYVAREPIEYEQLKDRFYELTAKRDDNTNRIIGYRTRVVHMGERIETIVPTHAARTQLFMELDKYVRAVIDHMIVHSEMSFENYLKVRDTLRPFEKCVTH
jgi:hypothetical protein